ncbi:hypothetical protein T484DRAFT_1757012 [Baffinella frigidus]|nr:hypothetical protein T484DRAFT_1757012 [Cryptophyta sp. CCMP2293]
MLLDDETINADINARNHLSESALILAVKNGNIGIVRMLCCYPNLDVWAGDKFGSTALHHAAFCTTHNSDNSRPWETLELLMKMGAVVALGFRDNNGDTPMETQAFLEAFLDKSRGEEGYDTEGVYFLQDTASVRVLEWGSANLQKALVKLDAYTRRGSSVDDYAEDVEIMKDYVRQETVRDPLTRDLIHGSKTMWEHAKDIYYNRDTTM